ncbi:MAG: InlB B-repeat-containing protein, partial [Clostridia bacterium]|nr:InlB B-repeat-containing protein [Clostridia bacterium]
MKKKILSFILAVCLIIPCAFIFSACGEKPADPIMHTVTFLYDNGMENSAIEVEEGKLATKPIDPSKTGYNFAGWYVDDEKWSFALIPVTQDIELTAKWNIKTFTVTFKYDNGLEDRETICNYGDKVKEPQQPQKNTHVFLGWFNGETKWDFEEDTISDNLELVAHWQISKLAVTFDPDNGEQKMVTYLPYGSKIGYVPIVNPTKVGYTFDAWYFGEYKWNFGYNTVTEALTLKAHWLAINYSITYELDGGTNNESNLQSYNADNNITFAEATKDSYKFMGWFVDIEFKNEITSTNGYHQHLTVFAKWARINKITYELNGGTNNIDNPTTFFEYEEVVLKAPTKDDEYKVFTGWFLDNHYEEKIETIPAGTAEDIKLWAKWEDIFKIDNKGEQYEKITGLTAVGKTLKKLAIPRNVKGIGNCVFANSDILEEVVFNGNDKVTLGYGAFQNCSKLTSVILPSGTRNI